MTNIEAWAWLIVPLGACRAVQLLLHDRILDRPRNWVQRRFNPNKLKPGDEGLGYIGYLYQCPWCISVWVGVVIVLGLANETTAGFTLGVLLVFAISLAAVVIDRLIDVYASDEAAAARAAAAAPPPPPAPIPTAVATAFDQYEPQAPARVPGLPADEG